MMVAEELTVEEITTIIEAEEEQITIVTTIIRAVVEMTTEEEVIIVVTEVVGEVMTIIEIEGSFLVLGSLFSVYKTEQATQNKEQRTNKN